ncbi:MAG: DEAD/DEAH box helicase [Bacteroidetes bacterium]|nr:DEAD/DEAH box helicase [Bacteroidota bacterium]
MPKDKPPVSRKIEIQSRLAALEREQQALHEELDILIAAEQAEARVSHPTPHADSPSEETEREYGTRATQSRLITSDERIAFFHKLFACREDVFPKLWENKQNGKKGYSPACKVEWVKGICEKPAVKCSECINHQFIRLDTSIIRQHLEGTITAGTYAIRTDDTCIFLAIDFDKSSWKTDVEIIKSAARKLGIELYIERSRSGNGAHLWIFFAEPIPASSARQLGSLILTHALAQHHLLGFESYDRFFPNQDTLPKGGFGNLIALPLQRECRKKGNSVFLDETLEPFDDQWEFLSTIKLLSGSEVKELLFRHLPVIYSLPIDETMDAALLAAESTLQYDSKIDKTIFSGEISFELSLHLSISIANIPSALISAFKRTATFANPKFFELQRLRFSTWNTPRYICCASLSEDGKSIVLPRGLLEQCSAAALKYGATVSINDHRKIYPHISVAFSGTLTPQQDQACKELLAAESGVLVAAPGSGKTVLGCAVITNRQVPTLILVHRKQLADQWKAQLLQFTDLKKKQIGLFDVNGKRRKGIVDIGMIQTVSKVKDRDFILSDYGLIIIDECHHVPAVSFESVINKISARYFLGLTATPYRKDGLEKIIHMQCGPIRYTMSEDVGQSLIERSVVVRETNFTVSDDDSQQPALHHIWEQLVHDTTRLSLVAHDVTDALKEGRFPLILSDRRDHLELLLAEINKFVRADGETGFLLTSDMGKKKRLHTLSTVIEMRRLGQQPFLLSTGSLIGEGFDLPGLCTLFLAMPLSFKGRLIQYAGRLHRESKGKTDVRIYDYVDTSLGLGVTMFRKRVTTYRKMGYRLDIPPESKVSRLIGRKK